MRERDKTERGRRQRVKEGGKRGMRERDKSDRGRRQSVREGGKRER